MKTKMGVCLDPHFHKIIIRKNNKNDILYYNIYFISHFFKRFLWVLVWHF